MKTDTVAFSKTFPSLKVLKNPSISELRRLAKDQEQTTDFGAPAYFTKMAGSRSAGSTFFVDDGTVELGRFQNKIALEKARTISDILESRMPEKAWIQLDRMIGTSPEARFHVRLMITQDMARVALLWCQTLFPAPAAFTDPNKEPDILTVYCPTWLQGVAASARSGMPEKIIVAHPGAGINYILGVDYVGECKMSFLRLAMFKMKQKGGLGLHAGSKSLRIKTEKGVKDFGYLLFGLSGTGKTTLTLEDHGLKSPEGVTILQDDIVLMTADGAAYGTENNFYVKTEGLTEEGQPGLYKALMNKETVYENVAVDKKTGKILFTDYSHGTNGRALAFRESLPNSSKDVDLSTVHKMIFITRRDTIVPPLARLDRTQAVAYFMLGESIETSAGDASKAGQSKREVGFNPFIIGMEDEEGNRLMKMLEDNPEIEVYLLNTGMVGKGADIEDVDPKGHKITKDVSSTLIQFIARGDSSVKWVKDPDWGYEVPERVPAIPSYGHYDPRCYYKKETYAKMVAELKKERRDYLKQFSRLDPRVLNCI